MPLGEGVGNYLFTSISSFHSFTPTIPWCQGGTWHQFSFRRKAAPELYGSSELGVLLLLYWRLKAGAPKKKASAENLVFAIFFKMLSFGAQ